MVPRHITDLAGEAAIADPLVTLAELTLSPLLSRGVWYGCCVRLDCHGARIVGGFNTGTAAILTSHEGEAAPLCR